MIMKLLTWLMVLYVPTILAQYCTLPLEPHVQYHGWETYGPNGEACGELRGWSMNHGCFSIGNTCGNICSAGNCYCIYACEPGYCMTQFNPQHNNIYDPSHGVLCNANGTITKVYNPNAPLCVPCASKDPMRPSLGLVTQDGAPSPTSFISSMTRSVPVCGLMDPGIDDGLQIGEVSKNTGTLYGHVFPKWWYLSAVQSQIYIQIPDIPATTSCVTKRNPLLDDGNAGFYQVVFTSGGGIELYNNGGIFNYLVFGQIAFFGDFGNNNNKDLSMCYKYYQEKCIVNYGIRGWVCGKNQEVPNCRLDCDLFMKVSDVANNGSQATICKKIKKCNLASCPDPTKCLVTGDHVGCSPIANLDIGERIVYELYDETSTYPVPAPIPNPAPETIPRPSPETARKPCIGDSQISFLKYESVHLSGKTDNTMWIILIVVSVVVTMALTAFLTAFYFRCKAKKG